MTTTELPAGTWEIDTTNTTVNVSVKKLGAFTIPATLTVASGTIEIDEHQHVTSVDIAIDAGSYTSKNAKRNAHISSADFLDAETHPTIRFQSNSVAAGASGYAATGTVTAKGQSAPVDVAVTDVSVDQGRGTFTATATVDRTAIGVDKLPSFVIGRSLQIAVSASATKAS